MYTLFDLLSLCINTVKCFYVVIGEEQARPPVAVPVAAAAFERAHSSFRD